MAEADHSSIVSESAHGLSGSEGLVAQHRGLLANGVYQ